MHTQSVAQRPELFYQFVTFPRRHHEGRESKLLFFFGNGSQQWHNGAYCADYLWNDGHDGAWDIIV